MKKCPRIETGYLHWPSHRTLPTEVILLSTYFLVRKTSVFALVIMFICLVSCQTLRLCRYTEFLFCFFSFIVNFFIVELQNNLLIFYYLFRRNNKGEKIRIPFYVGTNSNILSEHNIISRFFFYFIKWKFRIYWDLWILIIYEQ